MHTHSPHLTDEQTENNKTDMASVMQIVKSGTMIYTWVFLTIQCCSWVPMPHSLSFPVISVTPTLHVSTCWDSLTGPILIEIINYSFSKWPHSIQETSRERRKLEGLWN